MIHVYVIRAPGNDLDGETFEVQDASRESADVRAASRVRATFALTRRTDVRAEYVRSFESRRALAKAEAGDICKRHDFRDGDICSRCDAMRRTA